MGRACRFVLIGFLLLYSAALGPLAIGTFGLFGSERDLLAGVFLVPLGLPWNLMLGGLPESLLPWLAAAAPAVNLLAIWLICRALRRHRCKPRGTLGLGGDVMGAARGRGVQEQHSPLGERRTSMRFGRSVAVAAGLVFLAAFSVAPERAHGGGLEDILNGLAQSLEAEQHDKEIRSAFKAELDRSPSDKELRRYRSLLEEEHWTEQDIRDDLRGRSDYSRHSRKPHEDPEKVIRRAYEDILHREPDPEGMRTYRGLMIDKDWTENDVREALRKSAEKDDMKGEQRRKEAEKIVRRAYQDILGREPDANGMASYRNKVLHDGWDEHDVREALKRSPENRQKNQITRQQAEQIVRRAYQSTLRREPDPSGMTTFTERVLRDHWGEQDVARELRNSDEYRNKHR